MNKRPTVVKPVVNLSFGRSLLCYDAVRIQNPRTCLRKDLEAEEHERCDRCGKDARGYAPSGKFADQSGKWIKS